MTRTQRFARPIAALLGLYLCAAFAQNEASPNLTAAPPQASAQTVPVAPIENSAMSAETFFEIMLGEINVQSGEPGTGFSLILNAARKNNDATLYQRAVEVALQSRSGEAALQAARAWHQAQPKSRPANRAQLQILLALNRLNDTLEPLKQELAMAEAAERPLIIAAIPRSFLQASDKKLAASVVEQAITPYTAPHATAAAAWLAIGQMRLGSDDLAGTLEAAQRAQTANASAAGAALLALELMERKQPAAEALVTKYLKNTPEADIRMAYARVLVDLRRHTEAIVSLKQIVQDKPDFAESWLLLGSLQLQERQPDAAESSFKRFLDTMAANTTPEAQTTEATEPNQERTQARSRAMAQAYLALAQIAQERKDFAGAEGWMARIDNAQDLIGVQSRRASLLAQRGKMAEARQLIQALPQKNEAEARMKTMAEAQLLRDNKQYLPAYELLAAAVNKTPDDADLIYEQSMVAEKLHHLDEMERLLRRVIQLKPEYHHAYNALGFSLADRNVRLPEAKQLIVKALEATPNDPFIQDSLAWAEFRMGNKGEALRILELAYRTRPDVEIAAHLGEVLWSLGQRSKALAVWKEGQRLNKENETLVETLKRLHAPLQAKRL